VRRGWIGSQAGQGVYKKEEDGRIQTLDPSTFEDWEKAKVRLPAIDAGRAIEDPAARLRALFLGDEIVGRFLRATLAPTLLYAARIAPTVAHSIDDIDRAMRWGFGWGA